MKVLYLDLGAGAAGDMLAGALLGLLDEPARADALAKLNAALPAGVEAALRPAKQHGLAGWRFAVTVDGAEETPHQSARSSLTADPQGEAKAEAHHAHRGLADIESVVAGMGLDDGVAADVLAVYRAIAAAEGAVHGEPAELVHFHELGALDAVADVTAAALLLRIIGAERVAASPVAVGSGTVRCAHGVLPVPAPATALLLRGVPAFAGEGTGELCTPTGAALVAHFVQDFGALPAMAVERVGYGFGTKEFPDRPNCVRALLGETTSQSASLTAPLAQGSQDGGEDGLPQPEKESARNPAKRMRAEEEETAGSSSAGAARQREASEPFLTTARNDGSLGHSEERSDVGIRTPAAEEIVALSCNLDDMTPEDVGFALERIRAAGAVEAFTVPAGMKKDRPGCLLTALCRPAAREAVLAAMFAHTATLGVREQTLARYALAREVETVQTAFGPVRRKVARGFGVERAKWEYEDVARIAREQDMTLAQVRAVLDEDGRTD